MKQSHLESFRPVCPRCAGRGDGEHKLALMAIEAEQDGHVLEGALVCPRGPCQCEFPILDGIPLLFADPRGMANASMHQISARHDLSAASRSRLGDCLEPGSAPDLARLFLSTYAFDHYGEFFPRGAATSTSCDPGGVMRCLAAARSLAGEIPPGCIADVGCSAGRSTLELAMDGHPVLGLDAGFGMLRLAQQVLRTGKGRADVRRGGMVYEPVEWHVPRGSRGADFWCADACALPLPGASLAGVVALNVMDCLANPGAALLSWARALAPGGVLLLSTPFDWSGHATPIDAWLGGHSQRGPERGSSEAALRRHLAWAGFDIIGETDVAWGVRLHDRASTMYRSFVVAARRNQREPGGAA